MRHLLCAGAGSSLSSQSSRSGGREQAWKQQLRYSEQETQRRKAAQRSTKREPERKRHKEKPRGAEKEEGRSEDTQKRLEREQERGVHRCARMHAYLHQHLCCARVQKRSLPAEPKRPPVRMWEWGLGISKLPPAGAQQAQVGEEPGPDEGKQGLQMCGQMTGDGRCWGCFPSPNCAGSQGQGSSPCRFSMMTVFGSASLCRKPRALQLAQCRGRGSPDLKKVPSHLIGRNQVVLKANFLSV